MTTRSSGRGTGLRHNPAALLQARLYAKLSQTELARLAGISQPYVSRLENGVDSPSEETLAALAALCGVTPDSLRAAQ